MRVQDYLDKITWSIADKLIFFVYGFITLLQYRIIEPNELGLFALLINLNVWLFVVSDSFALQTIIQFGVNQENRRKINTISLILHSCIVLVPSIMICLLKIPITELFDQPKLQYVATALPLLALITIPRTYAIKFLYRDQELRNVFFVDLVHFGMMSIITAYLYYLKRHFTYVDMLYIYMGGTACCSVFSIWLIRKKLVFGWKGTIQLKTVLRFGFPLMLQASIHSLPKLLDIYIVQYFFSTASVGVYTSAKTLYRIFEEAVSAAYGLVYPSAVRLINNLDKKGLIDLMTKSASFILMSFLILIIALESGLSNIIITLFLSDKYFLAIGQFNLLILAAIALPFELLSLIITASGKPQRNLIYSSVGVLFSLTVFYFVGIAGNPDLIPLGMITYNFIFGSLCYFYIRNNYGFPVSMIFRSIGDSANFVKVFIKKLK